MYNMTCIQKLGYSELKQEQLKVVMAFVSGRDIFAILSTGYRKTLCYTCLPLVFDKLAGRNVPSTIIVEHY